MGEEPGKQPATHAAWKAAMDRRDSRARLAARHVLDGNFELAKKAALEFDAWDDEMQRIGKELDEEAPPTELRS